MKRVTATEARVRKSSGNVFADCGVALTTHSGKRMELAMVSGARKICSRTNRWRHRPATYPVH